MGRSPYPEAFRKEAVRKFLSRGDRPADDLAKEIGVSTFTLYGWTRMMTQNIPERPKASHKMSSLASVDKFDRIVSFLRLPESKQGEFLRTQGLTTDQITQWESEVKSKLSPQPGADSAKAELAQTRTKMKELEKEIRRKDKALAETTALLVLSKKLEALWGTESDEV